MKPTHRLCELHFRKEDIISDFGDPLLGQREKKKLKPDAVPVYFPHKEPPAPKRKPPTQRSKPATPVKKQKTQHREPTEHDTSSQAEQNMNVHDESTTPNKVGDSVSDFNLQKLFDNPEEFSLPEDDGAEKAQSNLLPR